MTKSEVRAVSLSKLELTPGAVFWDVGAGTGSVAVEAARLLGQMGGAGIGGLDAVVDALGLDLVQHGLKFPQDGDVPPDAHQGLVAVLGPLVGDGAVVGVDRDIVKVDGCRSAQLHRIDI